jgi:hypothetical protein
VRRPRHHRGRHHPRGRVARRPARTARPHRYELVSAGDAGWIRDEPGVEVVDFDGGYASLRRRGRRVAQRVLRRAVAAGDVTSFAPQQPHSPRSSRRSSSDRADPRFAQSTWLVAEREIGEAAQQAFLISFGILFLLALGGVIWAGFSAKSAGRHRSP